MKKIVSMALIAALIVSAAGCGEKAPAETTAKTETTTAATETVKETTAKEEAVEETTTTAAETTTEATTEAPPREIKNITKYKSFGNGTLFFEIGNTGYVYDILENKMYDYDSKELKNIDYACGKLVADDKKIANLETMETYDAELLYYKPSWFSTYNPVYSVKEDFDGNVYSFGILGSNGEWVLPMSTEYAVCDLLKSNKYLYANQATASFVVFSFGDVHYFYNYKTYEIIELDNAGYWGFVDNYVILYDYDGQYKYNRIYNTNTKETTELGGEYNYYKECDNCIWLCNQKDVRDGINNGIILDSKGNVLDYDLSEYNGYKIIDATEDYIVFAAKNTDGDEYTIILDKNGNRVVDPIKTKYSPSSDDMRIYGDYVINTNSRYIVNCKTGEMKTYSDDNLSIEAFDKDSGMLLMKSDGAYYLADPADPDTLLNPFELVQG